MDDRLPSAQELLNMATLRSRIRALALLVAAPVLVLACATQGPGDAELHRWWAGLGPVLPHESFPADCKLCHVGEQWHELRADFAFDHARETGVPLDGAHARARCLRCHNDRGPVALFAARGCNGCHEDPHQSELGKRCEDCHAQSDWRPVGQRERHARTRFPLTGAHANVACHRCHPGAMVGNFLPADPDCLTCHSDDLAKTTNPPHLGLGWVDDCDRCHVPTRWRHAKVR
jgi:hypothetical protein